MSIFRRKPQPAPEPPPRGAHTDESARTHDVRHKGTSGVQRKARNADPPRTYEHDPWDTEMEISPAESDARARRHPQMDVCWPKPHAGTWQQRRRGPV